jgi:hypothetical protein
MTSDPKADEAELRRILDVLCADSARHGTPVSRADQDLFLARAMEISAAELPGKLEAVRKEAALAGLDLQTEIKYLLAVPNAARLILAAGGMAFLRAVPALRRTIVKEHAEEIDRHAQENARHAKMTKGLVGTLEALAAMPADGTSPRPYKPRPGGRPAARIRDDIVAAMVAFKRLNPEADLPTVFNHIRAKFPRKSAWAYTTLLRYYERAKRILTETR